MYNSQEAYENHGDFDYLLEKISCTFCESFDHCVAMCETHMVMVNRMEFFFGINNIYSLPQERTSMSVNKKIFFCVHCQVHGHDIEHCWKLHLELRSRKTKGVISYDSRDIKGRKKESSQS